MMFLRDWTWFCQGSPSTNLDKENVSIGLCNGSIVCACMCPGIHNIFAVVSTKTHHLYESNSHQELYVSFGNLFCNFSVPRQTNIFTPFIIFSVVESTGSNPKERIQVSLVCFTVGTTNNSTLRWLSVW